MWPDIMPFWYRRETFQHLRNYIANAWNSSFDNAFAEFSKGPHAQYNVLSAYAAKFEDKFYRVHMNTDTRGTVGIGSNRGRETDIRVGCCRSFNIGCNSESMSNDDHLVRKNNSPLFATNRKETTDEYYKKVHAYLQRMRNTTLAHMRQSCYLYLNAKWAPTCHTTRKTS